MPRRAAHAPLAALAALAAGCLGEASVSFQGTVVEGPITGYAFESAPATGVPIASAAVALCLASCGEPVLTGADGRYPEIAMVFAGFLGGGDTHIAVRVTAADGRTAEYATVYEDSDDPLIANPSCEDGCPPVFLNFTLAP